MSLASTQRNVLIRKNILAGFALKGWSALTVLLTVPLTLSCLGPYQNGIWLTISSMLMWVDMLDIGLGNGLRNQLTIDLAQDDKINARRTISSTLAMLGVIVALVLPCIYGIICCCNINHILNVDPSVVPNLHIILAVALTLVCMTFVLKFIGNVYMSHQLPAVNNFLIVLGQTIALLTTYCLYKAGIASLFLIIVVNTASPLLVWLAAYPYTFFVRYPALRPSWRFVSMSVARRMMNLGIHFFALQMASLVLFMSANLIISRLYSPELVNPYQITYRYFSLVLIIFTVICMPYWSATTDAYTRRDLNWIRQANKNMRKVILLSLLAIVLMVTVSSFIYQIWIGNQLQIPFPLSIAMGCYIAILISSMRYSYFLNGIGALRLQLITSVAAVVVFIPSAWLVAHWNQDLTCFVLLLCLVNIPGLIINHIQFNRIIDGKASGLWKE